MPITLKDIGGKQPESEKPKAEPQPEPEKPEDNPAAEKE